MLTYFRDLGSYRVSQKTWRARRLESRLWSLNFFLTFSCQHTSTCMIFKTTNTKFSSSGDFQNVVCLFCTVNITGNIKNFVQIAILLNKTKMVDIWIKKLYISGNIQSTKKTDHILEIPGRGKFCGCCFVVVLRIIHVEVGWRLYFVISISKILLPKLGWQINVPNHIKNQRQRSSRLATVMFRGTPCINKKTI